MTEFKVTAKAIIAYGFTVDDKFYNWEVLESISEMDESYFFMQGSQEAEPLVNAGLARWSARGDGSIYGTSKAEELYLELRPEVYELMETFN